MANADSNKLVCGLHPAQMEVWQSEARFKAIVAGRRFGKTYYAAMEAIAKVLEPHPPWVQVWHLAPTYAQAMDTVWVYLTTLFPHIWKHVVGHEGKLQAHNDRWLYVKGADRPEVLAGRALSHCTLDEYAYMKPFVWEHVVRPMLSDVEGSATMIGSPEGKNHFYRLFLDWTEQEGHQTWQFQTADNPFIPKGEVQYAKRTLSTLAYRRQYEGSFSEGSGAVFSESMFQVTETPRAGETFIAVDLAGFSDQSKSKGSKYAALDDTAIAVVKADEDYGWHVLDIISGRWDVRKTTVKILWACNRYKPVLLGIEKGVLKNALEPYLHDQMRRIGVFPAIRELRHGNTQKQARIATALQGRLEHGRITFADGEYLDKLKEQALDFPSHMTHDDMLDALSYVDQLITLNYSGEDWMQDTWAPIDEAVGF